jgi:hypothetical protein
MYSTSSPQAETNTQIKKQKFNSAPGCICSFHPKNIFLNFNCQKISTTKNSYVHIDNLCAFVQFREKTIFFMIDVKKTKHVPQKALFLPPNFVFFSTAQMTS